MEPVEKIQIVIIIFAVLLNGEKVAAQDSTAVADQTFVRFFYNKPPDSLRLNNELISVAEGKPFGVKPGKYTIEAFLDCHHSLMKEIEVKPKEFKPVALKFKHFSTSSWTVYNLSLFSDIITIPGAIALSSLNGINRKYILPITVSGIAGHIFWQISQTKQFDPCSREYDGVNLSNHLFSLGLGVESYVGTWEMHATDEASFRRVGPLFDFYINVNRELNATLTPKSFAANYGINLEIQKYLSHRIALSSKIQYLPDTELTVKATEYLQASGEFFREYETSEIKQLILIDLNADIVAARILTQEVLISLGGYWGNSMKIDKEMLVNAVLPPSYSNRQDTVKINYEVKNSGFTIGVGLHSPISRKISLVWQYKLYSKTQLILMNTKDDKIFQGFRAGLRYHL